MKITRYLTGALAALISCAALAATTTPVSLLNPTGSTSGQAILSTGPSTAPAWGPVSLSGITGTLAIANGGTGATSAANARTNLGVPSTGGNTFSGAQVTAYSNAINYVNDTSGSGSADLRFQSNTVTQWGIQKSSANNFNIQRYSAGSFVDNPISIATSTGIATFTQRPVFNGATPYDSANLTIANYAPLASPALTGTPTAPAPATATNNTQIATTSFGYNLLAAPPAIGSTTPNTGKFTTLTTTAQSKVIANNQNAQSIPNNTSTVVTTWTSVLNQGANFNASTGIYTAPAAGTYRVSAGLQFASATWAAGNVIAIQVRQNGTVIYQTTHIIEAAVTQPLYTYPIAVTLNCATSDTISVSVLQTQGGAVALAAAATNGYLMIDQMP